MSETDSVYRETMINISRPAAVMILLYVIQFIAAPRLLPNLYPISIGAIIIYIVTSLIACAIVVSFTKIMPTYFLSGDVIYMGLINVLTNGNIYIIGLNDRFDTILGANIAFFTVFFMQLIMTDIYVRYTRRNQPKEN